MTPPDLTSDSPAPVPVVREGRECPDCADTREVDSGLGMEPCPSCAPSVVSGGEQNEARCSRCDNRGWFIRDASGGREVQVACPDCSVEDRIGSRALEAGARAYSHHYSDVKWEEAAPCTRTLWEKIAGEVIEAAAPFLVSTSDEVTEARIEAATKAAAAVYPEDHDPIFVNGLARKMVEAAAPFLVSASDESATRDRVLAAIKETIDLHGAPPLAPTPDLEPSYSTLYRLVVAALDKKGQN